MSNSTWIQPSWPAPGVQALMSHRGGGVSLGPYASMNLGDHVGDSALRVAHNRKLFGASLGASLVYLRQVHGTRVLNLEPDLLNLPSDDPHLVADASVSTVPGLACVVMVADCLPVLFCVNDGRAVAAAHAGWRGLAAGVLSKTVAQLCLQAQCKPAAVHAWLGPCIGPQSFEVGPEVRLAFIAAAQEAKQDVLAVQAQFAVAPREGHCLANLQGLAREQLRACGVVKVQAQADCTVLDGRYFSYRRDGVTGRMAAAITLRR